MLKKLMPAKLFFVVVIIFLVGLALRIFSVYPHNIIIGFDQARDLFSSLTIWTDLDVKIIGPTAGNNTDLHHGIAWIYFMLPPLVVFSANPFWVVVWNSFFNAFLIFVLFVFGKSLFSSYKAGLVAAILAAISFYIVSYAGWLSNPSPTLVTVPLTFWGLWEYFQKKKWGLVVMFFFLGLSIQFELFFLYLIPVSILLWLVFKPHVPSIKIVIGSVGVFCLATLTMIATEIKYGFSGIKAILFAGQKVGGDRSIIDNFGDLSKRFLTSFSDTIFPIQNESQLVELIVMCIVGGVIIINLKNKTWSKALLFLLAYLISPFTMLFLGYHTAPWFLVGLPPAILLGVAFVLSRLKSNFLLVSILLILVIVNVQAIANDRGDGQSLLEPDKSALLASQLAAVDYTYQSSDNKQFLVNSVTNPLYVNAVWGYHYLWYGKPTYGFLPTWGGGDQLYPYNTLQKETGGEAYLYLIMDSSSRIPEVHRILARQWAREKGKLLETKDFDGLLVEKYLLL